MTLLLFPRARGRTEGWWRLDAAGLVARGGDWTEAAPLPGERVVLAAPAEAVALHLIDLPTGLALNQARAAARLAAAEVVAEPLELLHVAVGRDASPRTIAVVATGAMADWLAQAAVLGIAPAAVVPEPLLIEAPLEGERHWPRGEVMAARGASAAHGVEADLAAQLAEGAIETLDDFAVAAGLAGRLAAPELDLAQGPFQRRRRFGFDWKLARRLARIAAAILVVTLLAQGVRILRYDLAARRAAARAEAAAAAVLPRATRIADPAAQLDARLADLRGGGLGFSAMAAAVAGAVRDTGGVELAALAYDGSGRLTASVAAAGQPEIDAVTARLAAAGLDVATGPLRPAGGRQVADLTVTAP